MKCLFTLLFCHGFEATNCEHKEACTAVSFLQTQMKLDENDNIGKLIKSDDIKEIVARLNAANPSPFYTKADSLHETIHSIQKVEDKSSGDPLDDPVNELVIPAVVGLVGVANPFVAIAATFVLSFLPNSDDNLADVLNSIFETIPLIIREKMTNALELEKRTLLASKAQKLLDDMECVDGPHCVYDYYQVEANFFAGHWGTYFHPGCADCDTPEEQETFDKRVKAWVIIQLEYATLHMTVLAEMAIMQQNDAIPYGTEGDAWSKAEILRLIRTAAEKYLPELGQNLRDFTDFRYNEISHEVNGHIYHDCVNKQINYWGQTGPYTFGWKYKFMVKCPQDKYTKSQVGSNCDVEFGGIDSCKHSVARHKQELEKEMQEMQVQICLLRELYHAAHGEKPFWDLGCPAPTESKGWVMSQMGEHCNSACGKVNQVCNAGEQNTITDRTKLFAAFSEAGYTCAAFAGQQHYGPAANPKGGNWCMAIGRDGYKSKCDDSRRDWMVPYHQQLCYCSSEGWKMSKANQNCIQACSEQGLVCDSAKISTITDEAKVREAALETGNTCDGGVWWPQNYNPGIDTVAKKCMPTQVQATCDEIPAGHHAQLCYCRHL